MEANMDPRKDPVATHMWDLGKQACTVCGVTAVEWLRQPVDQRRECKPPQKIDFLKITREMASR